MARIRTIKPEFPQSETVGKLSRDARLLFVQLWTIVDDEGRARASSRMLASLLYPYDEDARGLIDRWMDELEAHACVRRYEVDGSHFLDIPNWLKHQKIDRASKSRLPPFDEASRALASKSRALAADLGPRTLDQDLGEDLPFSEPVETFPSIAPSQASGAAVLELVAEEEGALAPELPAVLDRRSYPEAFETLWSEYRPIASLNATKADAHRAWSKLSAVDREACWLGLVRYAVWVGEENARRASSKRSHVEVKHLATFINRRGWEPFIEEAQSAAG